MISRRYDNDGKPLLKLNELQLRIKQQVEKKVASGSYKFEKTPCHVCNGSSFELSAEKDRYGLYMPVVICRDCGLIQTNPRLNQKAYNEFYNVEYPKLYRGEEKPTETFFRGQYSSGRRIFDYLQANGLFKAPKNKFVLEAGCGAGGILHYFKEKGCRVKGFDLGEMYIEYGKTQYNLDLSVGTINSINLNETPDLIVYSHVLEHILTPNEELQKVHNILSATGILYIEIPGVKNLMHSYEMDLLRLLQNAHICHFTLTSLKNLLINNNFELIVGNEKINSVFRKVQNENTYKKRENDYPSVLAFLRKVERLRKCYPIPPYKLKDLIKSMLVKILKALGLLEFVQNGYHKLRIS